MSCGSAKKKTDEARPDAEPKPDQTAELRKVIDNLNNRIGTLETKVASLNDKTDATKNAIDGIAATKKAKAVAVTPVANDKIGADVEARANPADPDGGFINDNSIKSYRQGAILFEAQKYPEAVLAFSSFLERNADHPLAGSAQYLVGEAYYRQKEYRLATQEFQRVLTTYDRSPHVSDALERLALCQEQIKKPEEAARYRKQLTSMFPTSPAALRFRTTEDATKPGTIQNNESQEKPAETQIDTSKEKKEYSERIKQAVTEVISKTNQSALDEPPPTAPVPEQKETGIKETDAQAHE